MGPVDCVFNRMDLVNLMARGYGARARSMPDEMEQSRHLSSASGSSTSLSENWTARPNSCEPHCTLDWARAGAGIRQRYSGSCASTFPPKLTMLKNFGGDLRLHGLSEEPRFQTINDKHVLSSTPMSPSAPTKCVIGITIGFDASVSIPNSDEFSWVT